MGDEGGNLPFHLACEGESIGTVKFLYEADPQSIFAKTNYGFYPLHMTMKHKGEQQTEVAQFLIRNDPGSVSNPVPDNIPGGSNYTGYLPLHLACMHMAKMTTVQLLFDAYPDAIQTRVKGMFEAHKKIRSALPEHRDTELHLTSLRNS